MDRNCLTLAGGVPGATRVRQPSPPESKRHLHSPVSPLGCDLKGRVTSAPQHPALITAVSHRTVPVGETPSRTPRGSD